MASSTFHQLMQPLLRHLNVSAPVVEENQGLRIDFEHIRVQLTPLNNEELLVVASLGNLSMQRDTDIAWKLLAENDFDQPAPAINLTVQGEDKMLLLWCRERFLHLDGSTLIALFERLVDKANGTVLLATSQQT